MKIVSEFRHPTERTPIMWVVWNGDTGYSDESMRFADRGEAELWIREAYAAGEDAEYGIRYES